MRGDPKFIRLADGRVVEVPPWVLDPKGKDSPVGDVQVRVRRVQFVTKPEPVVFKVIPTGKTPKAPRNRRPRKSRKRTPVVIDREGFTSRALDLIGEGNVHRIEGRRVHCRDGTVYFLCYSRQEVYARDGPDVVLLFDLNGVMHRLRGSELSTPHEHTKSWAENGHWYQNTRSIPGAKVFTGHEERN